MYVEITENHVGKPFFRAFGYTWMTQAFIGRILPCDVGKRVFLRDGELQVESVAQRSARKKPVMFGTFLGITLRGCIAVALRRLDDSLHTLHVIPTQEDRDAKAIYEFLGI